jgi:F0F1-type ATP synthase membrane subunit b/b'
VYPKYLLSGRGRTGYAKSPENKQFRYWHLFRIFKFVCCVPRHNRQDRNRLTEHIHTWSTRVDHKLFLKGNTIMTHQRMLVCVFSLFFLFFLLPGCNGPAEEAGEKIDETVQEQQGQFDEAEKEIAKAKAEIENLRNDLTQARLERDEAKAGLEKAEQERRRILKEMEQLNTSGIQEKTTLESQQIGNGSQGQEEIQPQSENMEDGQQPAQDKTSPAE